MIRLNDIEQFTIKDGNINFIYELDHESLKLTYNETDKDGEMIPPVYISFKRVK